jgi:tetratricopeptide (TPR) repeat protein
MRIEVLLLIAGSVAGCGGAAAQFIDEAREANAQADALLHSGDSGRAAQVLQKLLSRSAPTDLAAPDRRAVLQDVYARLAGLALAEGNSSQALHLADAGLALGEEGDVFAVSLRTLRGRANQGLGRDLEAARDYEAAQVIAEALLEAALGPGGGR